MLCSAIYAANTLKSLTCCCTSIVCISGERGGKVSSATTQSGKRRRHGAVAINETKRAAAGHHRLRTRLAATSAQLKRVTRMSDAASKSARIGSWELDLPSRKLVWSGELYRIHGIDPGSHVSLEAALD